MHSPIYFVSLVCSVCGIWFVWDLGVRKLLLSAFRERLFELRFDLFRMAASGEVDFDNDAYRALETLMCGLLRFGHRVTLMGFIISLREQSRAKKANEFIDYHKQIELKISRNSPPTQDRFRHILTKTHGLLFGYMAMSSLILVTMIPIVYVLRTLKLWRIVREREISAVLESEVYRAETQRGNLAVA